jgi:hypothetical protein
MSVGRSNGDPNAPAAPSAGRSSGADEVECARRVAELETEVADLKDRLLRPWPSRRTRAGAPSGNGRSGQVCRIGPGQGSALDPR